MVRLAQRCKSINIFCWHCDVDTSQLGIKTDYQYTSELISKLLLESLHYCYCGIWADSAWNFITFLLTVFQGWNCNYWFLYYQIQVNLLQIKINNKKNESKIHAAILMLPISFQNKTQIANFFKKNVDSHNKACHNFTDLLQENSINFRCSQISY